MVVDHCIWVWDRDWNRVICYDIALNKKRIWYVPLDAVFTQGMIYYSPPNRIVLEEGQNCCYLDLDHIDWPVQLVAREPGLLWKDNKRIQLTDRLIVGDRHIALSCKPECTAPKCSLF